MSISSKANAAAKKQRKGPDNRHEELLSLQRQHNAGEDDLVPLSALAGFTADDFDAAIESFSAKSADVAPDPEETRQEIEEDKKRVANKWKVDVSGNKALLDAGYENFDERLVDPSLEHVALYAGFDRQYHVPPDQAQERFQQTLWSAYFDPLEEAKLVCDPDDIVNIIPHGPEDEDASVKQQQQYKPGSIEDLAEIFASGHVPSDHYLVAMHGAGYVRDRWVAPVTERQIDSWLASQTLFRSEQEWKTLLVPGHAVQFIDTVHIRGKLRTWVFHVKKGLLLSVVARRHDRCAHLYKLVTHYYTFSLQQCITLLEQK